MSRFLLKSSALSCAALLVISHLTVVAHGSSPRQRFGCDLVKFGNIFRNVNACITEINGKHFGLFGGYKSDAIAKLNGKMRVELRAEIKFGFFQGPFILTGDVIGHIKPGRRYKGTGKLDGYTATLWVADAETGKRVSNTTSATLRKCARYGMCLPLTSFWE
jgi:hypothetical protein